MITDCSVVFDYIKFNFSKWFWRYPDIQKLRLPMFYPEVKSEVLTDISAKYSKLNIDSLQEDHKFFDFLQCEATIEAIFYYRLERLIYLDEHDNEYLRYFAALMKRKTGIEIYYTTDIGKRFRIIHGVGTVIGPFHCIGDDVTLYQGVTIGKKYNHSFEQVTINNCVTVYAGAKVLGAITLEEGVQVAANSVLLNSTTQKKWSLCWCTCHT